jgi:hypothetical protein
MSDEAPKRGPGRPPRQAETQQRRRRREDMGDDRHLKLAVPAGLKEKGFVYRWVNETPGRIENKTVHDDWDIVKSEIDPTKDNGEGTPVRRPVGVAADGKPLYAYLCKKPEDYYKADKLAEQKSIAADEDNLRRGEVKGADALSGPHAYVPDGNTIRHGD